MKHNLLLSIILLSGCGPATYNECLLSEMKGQPKSMIPVAKKVCEERFPYEREIFLNEDDYSYKWRNRGNAIAFTIVKKHPNYDIRKIYASLFHEECSNVDSFANADSNVTIRFTDESLDSIALPTDAIAITTNDNGTSSIAFAEDAKQYHCLSVDKIYGIWRK